MHILHDEDEYELIIHNRVCTSCNGDLRKCRGVGCNGSGGYSLVKRPFSEVVKIKAKREKEREDAILAEADAIRARRRS